MRATRAGSTATAWAVRPLVARLLDAGAQGIILPRVEEPRLLEEALSWMRFPPDGKRGYGVNATMVAYEPRSFPEIIAHQNLNTLSVVQFETKALLRFLRRTYMAAAPVSR